MGRSAEGRARRRQTYSERRRDMGSRPGPLCTVRSSITGQPCLLRDGHEMDSPTRFHRYAKPEETT